MSGPKVLSLGELRAIEFPPQEWVVENLLPRGGLTGIFGREKIGKSLFISHMGMAIAMDQLFLDLMVTAGPVLFFPVEENLREVQSRLVALAGKHDPPAYVFPTGGEYDQDVRLDRLESWSRVEEAIKLTGATTAFIDPLRETHSGSENDADDMSPLLRPVRQCAHDTNTASAFVHHASRAGNARGSTAIAASCDQIIELSSLNEDEDLTATRLRIVAYGRYGPRKVLHARLGDNFRWSLTEAPVAIEVPSTRRRVLDFIREHAEPQTAKEIAARLGMNEKTVKNIITDLLDQAPARIVAEGRGVAGDPRRYRGVQGHLIDEESSPESQTPIRRDIRDNYRRSNPESSGTTGKTTGDNIVTFPSGSLGPCPQCRRPMEPGQRFVCIACAERARSNMDGDLA